jgi:hypothetical protein
LSAPQPFRAKVFFQHSEKAVKNGKKKENNEKIIYYAGIGIIFIKPFRLDAFYKERRCVSQKKNGGRRFIKIRDLSGKFLV